MTRWSRLAAALVSLAVSTSASAQEAAQRAPLVGLGLSSDMTLLGAIVPLGNAVYPPPVQLYVPIAVTPAFRLEPSIGWLRVEDEGSTTTPAPGLSAKATTSSSFSLGLGALWVRPLAPKVQLNAGGRLTAIWSKDQTVGSDPQQTVVEAKQQNLVVAGVLGVEYLPSPWFSVGIEGQLAYTRLGDYTVDQPGGAVTKSEGGSATSTNALLFVRGYVF